MRFKGTFTAIITPFDESGKLDKKGLRQNINAQIEAGVDGLVPVGSTGECGTLSHEEHKEVVEITIDEVNGEIPVIAGTGSNSTWEAINLTSHAAEAGADGVLLVGPYYNKPTQQGLYEHYKKLAEEVDIPQIIYNIPSRTGRNINADTIVKLAQFDNIVGVKEASGDLSQVTTILNNVEDFSVLSGDDSLTLPMMSLGGVGVISVTSNLLPEEVSKMVSSFLEGDLQTAREINYKLLPFFKSLFIETNPGPVKAAMKMIGRAAGKPRLPLVEVTEETKEILKKNLEKIDLL